jgi:hypothetical protein
MDTKILTDYAESKAALEILQKEVDEAKAKVVEFLKTVPGNRTMVPGYGTFTFQTRITYEYSKVATDMYDQFVRIKKQEEQDGTAKAKTINEFPVIRKEKNE